MERSYRIPTERLILNPGVNKIRRKSRLQCILYFRLSYGISFLDFGFFSSSITVFLLVFTTSVVYSRISMIPINALSLADRLVLH